MHLQQLRKTYKVISEARRKDRREEINMEKWSKEEMKDLEKNKSSKAKNEK